MEWIWKENKRSDVITNQCIWFNRHGIPCILCIFHWYHWCTLVIDYHDDLRNHSLGYAVFHRWPKHHQCSLIPDWCSRGCCINRITVHCQLIWEFQVHDSEFQRCIRYVGYHILSNVDRANLVWDYTSPILYIILCNHRCFYGAFTRFLLWKYCSFNQRCWRKWQCRPARVQRERSERFQMGGSMAGYQVNRVTHASIFLITQLGLRSVCHLHFE